MSDGGKGSAPRPFAVDQATFASNWDRTFSRASITGSAGGSNPPCVGSSPTPAATYIDAETGKEVTEDWWPEITDKP